MLLALIMLMLYILLQFQVLSDDEEEDVDDDDEEDKDNGNEAAKDVNDESDGNEMQAIIDESASAVVQAIDTGGDKDDKGTTDAQWRAQKQKEILKEILNSSIQKIQSQVSQLQEMVSLKSPLKGQRTIDYYFKKRKVNETDSPEKLALDNKGIVDVTLANASDNETRSLTSNEDKRVVLPALPDVDRQPTNMIKKDSEVPSATDLIVVKGKLSKTTYWWWSPKHS